MDFALTEEQTAIFDMALAFGQENIAPYAAEWERQGTIPKELWPELGALGLGGVYVSEDSGGSGLSRLDATLIFEALSHACPSVASFLSIHNMCAKMLDAFGSDDIKARYLTPAISMDTVLSYCLTEPGSGSDLASLQTRAKEDGDDFIINGQKIWTSTAHAADMIFCLVRTEPDAKKHEGISYLIFSMKTPGIEVRPLKTMTGHAEFNEVFFTDVRVPQKDIVAGRGQGWYVANATLKHERGMLGDPNQAGTRLKEIVDLMHEETVDGMRLIDHPVYRDRLMQLQARVFAMQFHGLRLLTATSKKEDPGIARLIVKLQGCELNHQLAALAIDALGEIGVLYGNSPHLRAHGSWQHRYMFDLGLIIGGGTAQIQKNIISERGLGMPREPKPAKA